MAPVKHPRPFEDLAEISKPISYDPQRSFKDQLRAIDVLRGQSADCKRDNDPANAYVYLARAAAVVNDYLPHHSQYNLLTEKQKVDLANNGGIMLRTLKDLEPDIRAQYRDYQAGIANGTIQPPARRRRTDEDKKEKDKRQQGGSDVAPPVTMPRTPTSIEDHSTTTRSMKPTPGVSVMLTEAQEREQAERLRQVERDRAARERGFHSSDDDRARRSNRSAPETAMPTPVPTPDRRETNTLSVSQTLPPASSPSSVLDRRRAEVDAERVRTATTKLQDEELRRAMKRLQDQYQGKLQAVLDDPTITDETKRLNRALEIVAETGHLERDWIEEKNRLAIQERRPSNFKQELADQSQLQESRMRDIHQTIKERADAAYRRQTESRARVDVEEHVREQRLQADREALRREVEADALRERHRNEIRETELANEQRARDSQIRAERERERDRELTRERGRDRPYRNQDYDVSAVRDAVARMSLASKQRTDPDSDSDASRDRQHRRLQIAQAHPPPLSGSRDPSADTRLDPPQTFVLRSASHSPNIQSYEVVPTHTRYPSGTGPSPVRGYGSQPAESSSSASNVPAVLRPGLPVSPMPRRPVGPRGEETITHSIPPIAIPPRSAAYAHAFNANSPKSHSSSSLHSQPTPTRGSYEHQRDSDDADHEGARSLRSRPSYVHSAVRSATFPQEKLAAIAALPIESPTRSFHGNLEELREQPGRPRNSTPLGSPPPLNELLPAGSSPNYTAFMSRLQKSQGYVPPQTLAQYPSTDAMTHEGTPNGLLFQPIGVTSVPGPGGTRSMRAGSLSRSIHDPPSVPPASFSASYSASNAPSQPSRLRPVRLPSDTLQRFVTLASINTAKKKETLGMLYGKANLVGGYDITTLLVPKQTSTEHTCNMTNYELIVQFSEARGVIQLGWIHTHPTQSCFMSSMDLHTHAAYQKQLPESIAIVCSPRHQPNFGIFRLTDHPGMPLVLGCDNKASFHPHTDREPIYTDADKEHVQLMSDVRIEIVDLR